MINRQTTYLVDAILNRITTGNLIPRKLLKISTVSSAGG